MNIFQQFFSSIYAPQLIAKFRFQGIGKSILYVFVLMLITFSVSAFQLGSGISKAVNEFHIILKEELPEFELKNSVLTSEIQEPMIFNVNGDNFVFDSTGSLTVGDIDKRYNNVLALLENEAVFIADGVTQSFSYREIGNISMTKTQLEELTETIVDLLPLIISIVVFILYVVFTAMKFLGIFFLSFVGLIIKNNLGISPSYKQIWTLSAYAVTLPTLFFAITDSLYIQIPFSLTLYWVVSIIMLYLIFKEIPKPNETIEQP